MNKTIFFIFSVISLSSFSLGVAHDPNESPSENSSSYGHGDGTSYVDGGYGRDQDWKDRAWEMEDRW